MNKEAYSDYLDVLARQHRDRLVRALQRLENRVAELVIQAPTRQGELFDLAWAIDSRVQLRQAIDGQFLTEVQSILEEYEAIAAEHNIMLNEYAEFARLQPQVINQLQRLSFYGFEDIASTFLNEMADGIYQNTLTGRSAADLILDLRQKINGVYIQSDQDEIERLVEIANFGTDEQSEAAIRELHTVYASDRLGRNMRRYATQMVQDSLMQFDASISVATAKEAGVDKFEYYGDIMDETRDWCIRHVGKVYSQDEIETLWADNVWAGKADGDPMIVRGGYNCRHHWMPTFDE